MKLLILLWAIGAVCVAILVFHVADAHGATASTQPAMPALPTAITVTHYVAPTGSDTAAGTEAAPWETPRVTGSHQKLLIKAGVYLTSGINLSKLTDVAIDQWGNGPLPVLHGAGGVNIFSFDANTQRISIAHVRCDSDYSIVKTAGGYQYHQPKAAWGNVRGCDITIDSDELANLSEGISVQGATRIAITNCNQVDPLGMPSRCVYVDGGVDLTLTGCKFTNSTNESPLRATGNGITRGLVKNNKIGQLLDAAHDRATAKAAVTIRQADGLWFVNNTVTNGELSFNTDITGKQLISNSTIQGGIVTGSQLTIRPGTNHCTITGLIVQNFTGSECVSDSAAADAGNVYDDLNLAGSNCGIKSYGPSNFRYQHVTWSPSKAGLPLIKGDLSKAVNGGGNTSK